MAEQQTRRSDALSEVILGIADVHSTDATRAGHTPRLPALTGRTVKLHRSRFGEAPSDRTGATS